MINFHFAEKGKEVLRLIDDIRNETLEDTSPEMAEWAKEFTPEMEKLKTKLNISKLSNFKVNKVGVSYEKIFPKHSTDKRLLIKARPGFGKTMCAKKITWDWAKGTFTNFRLVFLVNAFRTGNSIFDMIIEQYSKKGFKIKEETLRDTFESLGDAILVILDGLDGTCAQRQDLGKVVDLQTKFCHKTLVTMSSDPGINTENYFQTVCQIAEFSSGEAKFLINSFSGGEEEKVDRIVNSKVSIPPEFGSSWFTNPMLLMFLCFLTDKDQLHSNRKAREVRSLSVCDLYLKLVTCLCDQTIRALCHSVKTLGKVVLGRLQSGTGSVYNEGDFASILKGRLLIRHGDGLVSLPHRSFEIFLGALYFILMLDCGESVDSLLESDTEHMVFFTNQLFLYFCLSMVDKHSLLPLSGREKIDRTLQTLTLGCIDFNQLDFFDIASLYPNLNLASALKQNDDITLKFVHKVLSRCKETKVLLISPDLPIEQILSSLSHTVHQLASIILINDQSVLENNVKHGYTESNLTDLWQYSEDLKIIVQNQPVELLTEIRQCVENSDRKLDITFVHDYKSKPMIDICLLVGKSVRHVRIHQCLDGCLQCFVYAEGDLKNCQSLTSLTFLGVQIDDSLLECLTRAIVNKSLPSFTHLGFNGSGCSVRGKLSQLLRGVALFVSWPKLTHLDLTKCNLDQSDAEVVFRAVSQSSEFPVLSSLAISADSIQGLQSDTFGGAISDLTCLELHDVHSNESPILNPLRCGTFLNVDELRMSLESKVEFKEFFSKKDFTLVKKNPITSVTLIDNRPQRKPLNLDTLRKDLALDFLLYLNLSYNILSDSLRFLLCRKLPVLKSLVLRGCKLNTLDLQTFAQADAEYKLPSLAHLDIAFNSMNELKYLFDHKSKWENLHSLTTDWVRGSNQEKSIDTLTEVVRNGCLSSLRQLSFFTDVDSSFKRETCWTCRDLLIEKTSRSEKAYRNQRDFLKPLVENIEKVSFQSLCTIQIHVPHWWPTECDASAEKLRLNKRNISIYFLKFKDNSNDF